MFLLPALAGLVLQSEPAPVTNGKYVAGNGFKVELLGIVDPSSRTTVPVDGYGKPLSTAQRKLFEIYSGEKLARRPWTEKERGRTNVYAVFLLSGPQETTLGFNLADPFRKTDQFDLSMEATRPPEPAKGRLVRTACFQFSVPTSTKKINLRFRHPASEYQTIAKFDPTTGKCEDERFQFEVQTGTENAFKMTKKSRTDVTMDAYRGIGYIPTEFQGHDFDLTTSDAPKKKPSLDDFPMEMGGAYEAGKEGSKLKIEFFGKFKQGKDASRQLILLSRAQKFVTFEFNPPPTK